MSNDPIDEWSWLRADDWRGCVRDPEKLPIRIREHLEQENASADAWFDKDTSLHERLVNELRGRIVPVDDSLPDFHGPWQYVSRYREGDDYGVYLRRPREGGDEQILLDSERESDGYEYYDEGDCLHSPDHCHLAWSADTSGDERYELRIRNLASGMDLVTLQDVYEVTWGNASTLFYTRVDEDLRPSRVYRHRLGESPESDVLVFEETDQRFWVSIGTTRSQDWVIIDTAMTDCNEQWLIPCCDVAAPPIVVEPRSEGLVYSIDHQADRLIILTNADESPDFCLMEAPLPTTGRGSWRVLQPHRSGCLILDVEALGDWLIVLEREHGLPRIVCHHRDGRFNALEFDEEAYALGFDAGLEINAGSFRVAYASPTTPDREYEVSLKTGARRLLKERLLPSGHNPERYETQRIHIPSHDGVEVPVTLLYHVDTAIDGTAPALIHGYGAYGSSTAASFSSRALSLVDRGFVFVLAHVRGGQELGRAWYESGRLERKQNSFEDLYAIAQGIVERKFAARGRIVLQGGSAGGLLVAATMDLCVRRDPNLLAGVIADVPFVDVLNTMLDASLPLTPGEWSEWGNPIQDEAARELLRSYSPYEQVGARLYPALYVTAGVSDPRVTWWEPAKWVARLRQLRTSDAPLLLRTNMASGHFGDTGRYSALDDTARELAFAIRVAGAAAHCQ